MPVVELSQIPSNPTHVKDMYEVLHVLLAVWALVGMPDVEISIVLEGGYRGPHLVQT